MLRVNVGLSRKLSKDYNSTGYSVNLDGEITAQPSDAQAVVEQVKELFDLAEEALDQQIERERSIHAVAQHDENNQREQSDAGRGNGHQERPSNGHGQNTDQLATNKQVQYLLSIAKRQRLSTLELEHKVAEILGCQVGLYDLTKQAAGIVIDALTGKDSKRTAGASR